MRTNPAGILGATLGAAFALSICTAALAQTPDPTKWEEVQSKAREEGKVVVAGPPFQGLRTALASAFKQRYGIELNYLGMFAGEVITRVDTESKAGKVSIDADLGGTSTCWAMSPRGQIENMNGKLIDADLRESSRGLAGKAKVNAAGPSTNLPANFLFAFQTSQWVMTDSFATTPVL